MNDQRWPCDRPASLENLFAMVNLSLNTIWKG